MDENVMYFVYRGYTIGVYNLVNIRKVVSCINIKTPWLSVKWNYIMFQTGLMLYTLLRQNLKESIIN